MPRTYSAEWKKTGEKMENARRFEIQARHSVIPEKGFPIQLNISSLSFYFPAQVTVCQSNHMISSPSGFIGFPELLRLSDTSSSRVSLCT